MMVTVFSILISRMLAPWILVTMGADVFWVYATSILDFSLKAGLNMARFRKKKWMQMPQ